MNVFLHPPPIRYLLLVVGLLLGVFDLLPGQSNNSPYRNLSTAINVPVADTVSGQSLSIYAVSPQPKHGVVNIIMLNAGVSGTPYVYAVKYTPNAGYIGTDTFTIELNYQGSYPYLIYRGYRVSVLPSIIDVQSDFAVTTQGTPVTTNVLANDNSSSGPLTLTSIPLVNHGTAMMVGGNSITFTPEAGFTGTGHVNYVVCDALGTCKTAQYTIGIHSSGAPVNDTLRIATAKNTPLTMPLTYTGFSVFQAPANGNLMMLNGHSFRYTPNLNFTGTDQFILSTSTYGSPVFKSVVIAVLNTPAQNTMALDDYAYTPKGQAVTFNVRNNDIGNLLVKGWVIPPNLPGTVSNTNGIGNVTFTPNPNFTGVATFYYKIGNMFVPDLEMAAVNVVVGNMNPSAGAFDLTTPKSTPLVVNYQIPFTGFGFTVIDPPDHGTCSVYPGPSSFTFNGQTVTGNNLLVYTPNTNYVGLDEFEINYCITASGQCQNVKITMTVTDVLSAPPPYCIDKCVWTGDVNNDGVVNNKDILPLGYFMGMNGPARSNAALEWYGQQGSNWNNPFVGNVPDLKFADTDGNGALNTDDTLAIGFFYGQTHNLTPYIAPTSKGLPFFFNILTPNPGVGDLVEVEVSLGNTAQPVTNLYGFTFNVALSPIIVDSALQMQYFNDSWLNRNSPDLWMYKNPAPGRLESAFTRTNGVAASGQGLIGKFSFIIIDIIEGAKLGADAEVDLILESPELMWADGSTTSCEPFILHVPLRLHKNQPASNDAFFVYPSPASDLLQIHLNGDDLIETLQIFDMSGKTVYDSGDVQWEHAELNVGNLPNGLYVAFARTANGFVRKKFQILR